MCICSCLLANVVSVCVSVCVCVCVWVCVCVFLGSCTNKSRGPVDVPIKKQEEWGRTNGPSVLCKSLKLEMASGVKTSRML